MATATATEPIDLADAPTPEHTPPVAVAEPGPLARLLTPVEPARAIQPLGTTAAMEQPAEDTSSAKKGAAKTPAAKPVDRDGAVSTLVRALAARLGRTGTTTKRTHTVTETRATGASSRADRSAKSTQTGQDRTSRESKAADLSSKAAQRPGRNTADTRKGGPAGVQTSDTKAPRGPQGTRTADPKSPKPDATVKRDISTKAGGPARAKDGAAAKADRSSKPDASARPAAADPATKADPKGLNAKTPPATKPANAKRDDSTKSTTPKATSPKSTTKQSEPAAKPLRTQPSREAGYRDGTRAAAVAGHANAYRDGTKDGWHERAAADRAEKEKMDKARTKNAIKPKADAAPKMTPAAGSTVDLAKAAAPPTPAVPVQVDAVGVDLIHFTGDDGVTSAMTRGEVRTLRQFERRLAERQQTMGRIADGSKVTRALAVEMSTRAQRLSEEAKAVKGGAALVGVLLRLAERAQALRNRAEEIERNAHRGAEAVTVLSANAETRHGGIYKAVVESPLTAPAEREFYQDKDGS